MTPRGAPAARRLCSLVATAALLAGCPKPKPDAPPPLVQTPTVAPILAGRVNDGAFVDATWPLLVPIPAGWTATVGEDASPERLTLADPDGDVRVTIAATNGTTLAPRPLSGCAWTFQDIARYRAVKVPEAVLAATCTPHDPDAPRVLAYVIARDGVLFHVEGHVPAGRLRAGKTDLDVIVGGVRFR